LLLEVRFIDGAEGTDPVGGQVFELGAGSDAVLRIALCRVILIPADVANILFHIILDFRVNNSTAKIRLFFYMCKNIFTRRTAKAKKEHGKRHGALAVMK
jgi:hypothetical protein